LLGFSFGGYVAFEMPANSILAVTPGMVGMIDTLRMHLWEVRLIRKVVCRQKYGGELQPISKV